MSALVVPPPVPSLVVGQVTHVRRTPMVHRFRHRHYQWLVDLDDVPRLRWPLSALASFDPADHFDGSRQGGGIRGGLERFLAQHDVEVPSGTKVLMLAHARSLGHVFNPLTVFWCVAPDGRLVAAVLEVHNTYGGRHAYLVEVDEAGRTQVDKAFYVSPFNDVSGEYRVRLVLDERRVTVVIRLVRDGQIVLDAALSGTPTPATGRTLLSTAARHLFMTHRVTALIRVHGVRLWMRRLPVVPRPRHLEEAVR